MEILFTIVPIGIVISLITFLIFESRALKARKEIRNSGVEPEDFADRLDHYDTLNNTIYFGIVVYIFTFIISNVFYSPEYGLIHALMYIFVTTFIGSAILFVIKIKKDLLIKVFAAFLYGVAHIFGASFAFLTSFIIS
jgi:hypothetical protein